jgi:hypothetical protein
MQPPEGPLFSEQSLQTIVRQDKKPVHGNKDLHEKKTAIKAKGATKHYLLPKIIRFMISNLSFGFTLREPKRAESPASAHAL